MWQQQTPTHTRAAAAAASLVSSDQPRGTSGPLSGTPSSGEHLQPVSCPMCRGCQKRPATAQTYPYPPTHPLPPHRTRQTRKLPALPTARVSTQSQACCSLATFGDARWCGDRTRGGRSDGFCNSLALASMHISASYADSACHYHRGIAAKHNAHWPHHSLTDLSPCCLGGCVRVSSFKR